MRYDLRPLIAFAKAVKIKAETLTLDFVGYNARDLGFNYLVVDATTLKGIYSFNASGEPVQILAYIHQGGSCGYPGGCNNGSPYQREMNFAIASIPAYADIKLWREKPATKNQEPDMVFSIEFIADDSGKTNFKPWN